MSELIEYSNPNLERQIKKMFGNSYGALQPIIIDILLKRNKVFSLTEEQTVEETQRIMDNLEAFVIKDEMPGRKGHRVHTTLETNGRNKIRFGRHVL